MNLSLWDWIWISSTALFALALLAKFAKNIFTKRPNIAVVSLNGVIKYDDKPQSVFKQFQKSLDEVARDKNIRAVILRVNSPGGTVGASQEIYDSILALRKSGVKVVALMEDVAASGGLYVSMAADHIVANPGTITGSIGVIIKGYDLSKLAQKLEIRVNIVKSGEFKDIMSMTRAMTERETALLQGIIDDTNEQFRKVISNSRKLAMERVREFADGRIMNGAQALELGVVNDCGGFAIAKEAAEELAGLVDGLGIVREVRPNASALDRFTHVLGKMNIFNGTGVLNELTLNSSGACPLPLWLMSGYDL